MSKTNEPVFTNVWGNSTADLDFRDTRGSWSTRWGTPTILVGSTDGGTYSFPYTWGETTTTTTTTLPITSGMVSSEEFREGLKKMAEELSHTYVWKKPTMRPMPRVLSRVQRRLVLEGICDTLIARRTMAAAPRAR